MKLTGREIRGIISLLIILTAVTLITTCHGDNATVPASTTSGHIGAYDETFVNDSANIASIEEQRASRDKKSRKTTYNKQKSSLDKTTKAARKKASKNTSPKSKKHPGTRPSPLDEPLP